jgi:N-glycosidase YbiA
MTNPVHNNPNISLNYTISMPGWVKKPISNINIPNDSLRMHQSSQGSFSFKSIWDAIVNCFKSLFSCFFKKSLSPNQIKIRIAQIAAHDQFIWFYKKEDNQLTASLGNFHPCPIQLWGMQFQCAEAAFQAAKFASNRNLMQQFQNLDGEAAFRLGRQLSRNWSPAEKTQQQNRNLAVMREVVTAKFTQNADLKELLLLTGNAYLVEHIPVKGRDCYWGDDSDGTGQNWLGRVAMEVRGHLGGTGVVQRNPQYNQFLSRRQ